MSKNVVYVVGTGTIGEPLIALFCKFQKELGIDEVTFAKKSAILTDRSKVQALINHGAKLAADEESAKSFNAIGIKPAYTVDEALENATVVVDCTPVGNQNKAEVYEKYLHNTKGFIAQGSEFGFGKMYARGINDETLIPGKDKFVQVVSCNTHNLSVLVKSIGMNDGNSPELLDHARFVCIRRSNDISQDKGFVPGLQVDKHSEPQHGTHHAHDAHELFKTLGMDVKLFSSSLKTNTQYMHTVWFHIKTTKPVTKQEILNRLHENDLVAVTHKSSSNTVFSFGRDHGHYGRILNQTVLVENTLEVVDGNNVYGWCFTPQDGNSLLSSIAATEFFMYPQDYNERIQCLKPYFFNEV